MTDAQRLHLLSELAIQLAKVRGDTSIGNIGVKFKTKRGRTIGEFDLDRALDALANDVYIFEECNISDSWNAELYEM
jgi:hypothetical protein